MLKVTMNDGLKKTHDYIKKLEKMDMKEVLNSYGKRGVDALKAATPVDSGETRNSWSYKITQKKGSYEISWNNSHMAGTVTVAILLQLGHGTGTGGYVQGRDYINPAMRPIFDKIAEDAMEAVSKNAR